MLFCCKCSVQSLLFVVRGGSYGRGVLDGADNITEEDVQRCSDQIQQLIWSPSFELQFLEFSGWSENDIFFGNHRRVYMGETMSASKRQSGVRIIFNPSSLFWIGMTMVVGVMLFLVYNQLRPPVTLPSEAQANLTAGVMLVASVLGAVLIAVSLLHNKEDL